MPRIGLDLTALPSLKGGVAYYLVELVAALGRVDGGNDYVLLVRAEHQGELQRIAPGFAVESFRLPARPMRLIWEQVRLPQMVRRLRLDVLHSPHYTRPLVPLACASVVGIMDLSMLLMGQHHVWSKRVFFGAMLPAAARRADRLIAISESTKRDVQRWLSVPADLIDVTPLAASAAYRPDIPSSDIEAVRQLYGLPERFVLFVGRLEPRKNLDRLLDAYDGLRRSGADAPPLVLAGAPGWHARQLLARIDHHPAVRRLGYVPEAHLPALYRAATLFVYPSLYEGFGIPVLEALSCAVPTIASNVSSIPEVAGDAAVLVDPGDTLALRSALSTLLSDERLQAELRERGPRQAARFSWTRTASATVNCYLRAHDQWRRATSAVT